MASVELLLYRSLLKACTGRKALAQTKTACPSGEAWVGVNQFSKSESVVKTLVKSGSLDDAVKVYER